jgi:hypothetical protein
VTAARVPTAYRLPPGLGRGEEADYARQERARGNRLEAALAEARRLWITRLLEAVRRREAS